MFMDIGKTEPVPAQMQLTTPAQQAQKEGPSVKKITQAKPIGLLYLFEELECSQYLLMTKLVLESDLRKLQPSQESVKTYMRMIEKKLQQDMSSPARDAVLTTAGLDSRAPSQASDRDTASETTHKSKFD